MNGERWRQTAEEAWNDAWEVASHYEREECLQRVTVSALLAISHDLARLADAQAETARLMRAHLASEHLGPTARLDYAAMTSEERERCEDWVRNALQISDPEDDR